VRQMAALSTQLSLAFVPGPFAPNQIIALVAWHYVEASIVPVRPRVAVDVEMIEPSGNLASPLEDVGARSVLDRRVTFLGGTHRQREHVFGFGMTGEPIGPSHPP
jgi:hypothetical protein